MELGMTRRVRGWVDVALGEVGEWGSGGTPKAGDPRFYGGEIPFAKIGDLNDDKFAETVETLTDAGLANSAAKMIPSNSLLVAMYGSIGKLGINLQPVASNQAIAFLRPDARLTSTSFMYWALRAHRPHLVERGQGGTQQNISQTILKALEIAVPPPAEQGRIVAKLDALTARTAAARAELDRIPLLAARYRQAVLAAAFSGEMTADWRARGGYIGEGEDLRNRILGQRAERRRTEGLRGKGANRSVPQEATDLPALPEAWVWMTFDECSWDMTVGHVGPMKDRYVGKGVPFLRSLNVKANSIDRRNLVFIDQDFHAALAKSRLTSGTIVVIRTGEPGVAAVVPEELDGANCSDLVICRPVDALNPHFAARYANSDFATRIIQGNQVGVAQQHFNVGAMSVLPVPVAPEAEQEEIVRRVDRAFAEIDRLAAEAAAARRLLDRLDQAILAKAFRGELVPQDPADEPATVLLDRIRAERAGAPARRRGRNARAA